MWSFLTFDKLLTGQVIHLVYWAGLSVIAVAAFSVIGASIGVALREGSWAAILLALPVLVVFGLGLAYLRSRTGSIYPGMILHAFFNAAALVIAVTM